MKKANDFAKLLKMENFKCSPWIQRFRDRHGISFGKVSGESGTVDIKLCDDWLRTKWPAIREGYKDDDIFNADEAGLFFKLMHA